MTIDMRVGVKYKTPVGRVPTFAQTDRYTDDLVEQRKELLDSQKACDAPVWGSFPGGATDS